MIPATYTSDTFSDYLEFEVMLEAARELEWVDLVPAIAPFTPVTIVGLGAVRAGDGQLRINATATSATQTVMPLQFYMPAGTKVNFSGTIRTTLNAANIGDTTVVFTASFTGTLGNTATFYAAPASPRQRNPQYDSIIDETLFRMGMSDISEANSVTLIEKLRNFGRREVWRAAMQATSGDYGYQGVARQQVYLHAEALFRMEDQRINNLYSESNPLALTTGSQAYSSSTKVRARW